MKHFTGRRLILMVLLLCLGGSFFLSAGSQQVAAAKPLPDTAFQVTFTELGYEKRTLQSPYGITEYNLRLPEGWQLTADSLLELDFSYSFQSLEPVTNQTIPTQFGYLEVVIDGQSQTTIPLKEPAFEHMLAQVPLPLELLNNPNRRSHTIRLTLNADLICRLSHEAQVDIFPTSRFLLNYQQLPLTADLALYPRPFYQRAFAPDLVRFVLPERPTTAEIQAAVTIAAKLGDLAPQLTISGTTDVEWTTRLANGDPFPEHVVLIGAPERNQAIQALQQLAALPLSFQERQMTMSTQGPFTAAAGQRMTYTLALTNTAPVTWTNLKLYAALPAYTQWLTCTPTCTVPTTLLANQEIVWEVPALAQGATRQYTWVVQAGQLITHVIVDTTATLLTAEEEALNASTLTTTLQLLSPAPAALHSAVPPPAGFFFKQGARAVPESDGIIQELIAPWDVTRAILVVTGLSDAAVARASLALSSENYFPGMRGAFALIQESHFNPLVSSPAQAADFTLADLGYEDSLLEGFSQETEYYFELPIGWQLNEGSFVDLVFSHSQLLSYANSEINVRLNGKPLTTAPLTQESASQGLLHLAIRPGQLARGKSNRLTIQAQLYPLNQCGYASLWLQISNSSRLHLERTEQTGILNLTYYPHPLDQQPDLGDLLFVLPSEPQINEWEPALQLSAALGKSAGGSTLQPEVALGLGHATSLTETTWASYHLLAIGRPSRNPLLQQVNAELPQPFRPGSDGIEQRLDQVIFRLPQDLSLGLVQLLISPLDRNRALLAVTGTTDAGLADAVNLLLTRPWDLYGNLALIQETTLHSIDSRTLTSSGTANAVLTAVPEMTATVTVTPTPTPLPPPTSTPAQATTTPAPAATNTMPRWLLPFIAAITVIIVGILVFALWQGRRRTRPSSPRR